MNWAPIGTANSSAAGYRCDMKSKALRGFRAAFFEKSASESRTPSPEFKSVCQLVFFWCHNEYNVRYNGDNGGTMSTISHKALYLVYNF